MTAPGHSERSEGRDQNGHRMARERSHGCKGKEREGYLGWGPGGWIWRVNGCRVEHLRILGVWRNEDVPEGYGKGFHKQGSDGNVHRTVVGDIRIRSVETGVLGLDSAKTRHRQVFP